MSIAGKLVLTFLAMGLAISLLSLAALAPFHRDVHWLEEMQEPALFHALGVETAINGAILEAMQFTISRDPGDRAEHRAFLDRAAAGLVAFRAAARLEEPGREKKAALLGEIEASYTAIVATSGALIAEADATGTVSDALIGEHERVEDRMRELLAALATVEAREVRDTRALAHGVVHRAERWLASLAAASVALAIVAGLIISRTISRPIHRLRRAALALAGGTVERVHTAGPGELVALARAFNTMADEVLSARSTLECTVAERTRDLVDANEALRLSEQRYRTLVEHAPEAIIVFDADSGRYVDANENAARLFGRSRAVLLACDPASLSPPRQPDGRSSAAAARAMVDRALAGEAPVAEWLHLRADGREVLCEVRLVRMPSPQQRLVRGSITDISERLHAEERRRLLLRELDHRVKNNLAAVQALCDLTAERAESLAEFRKAFTGRIQAMARTHEALARDRWQSLDLGETVGLVLAPYRDGRITSGGCAARVPGTMASSLGLVLHELATNSARHGSLSRPGGGVDVSWVRLDRGTVRLSWLERGGPSLAGRPAEGLGLRLVSGLVEREMGGAVALRFEEEGLECDLTLPLA